MQSRLVVVATLAMAGCYVEAEPLPCDEAGLGDHGVDIELTGLDDARTYFFEVVADGASLVILRTPDQRSTLAEAPAGDERTLVVALHDEVMRLFFAEADGSGTGPRAATITVVESGEILAARTFRPAYADAAPTDPDECGGFSVVTERMLVSSE